MTNKRFLEGEWYDDEGTISFLFEKIFILQERIKNLEQNSKEVRK